jgi:cardiolipin synthase
MKIDKDEILTWPNLLTSIRAFGIPLFIFLLLDQDLRGWSFAVLVFGAGTDYFDGKVARWLNQESRLGAVMDPTIDRLYIAATLLGLAIKHYIPWWMVVFLGSRDLYMLFLLTFYRRKTGGNFEVTFLGKSATFNLLYAFPFLLLSGDSSVGRFAHIFGWAFAIWGIGLYLLTAVDYSRIAINGLRPSKVTE